MQAGYTRDEALAEKVKSEWTLARIQAEVLKEVQKRVELETRRGGATDSLTSCAAKLHREALSATTLFNDFCVVRFSPARNVKVKRTQRARAASLPIGSRHIHSIL
jgi:hypothetical protein